MADIDLKTETPDTSLPTTGFLFGADSQASASPSVYSTQTVATTLLGSTSLTGATITTSQPVLDLAQTWNASGVTFTGLRFNAAGTSDANSAAASLLMDLQVGGNSLFRVGKAGNTNIPANGTAASPIYGMGIAAGGNTGLWTRASTSVLGISINGADAGVEIGIGTYVLRNTGSVQWNTGALAGSSADLFLTRRAAANLRLGAADAAAPVAQTLSVQSVVAGTTNTAGANLTITGSQGTGTGAGGSIIFQVAPAGSTGSAQNALATALTIASDQTSTFAGAVRALVDGSAAAPSLRLGATDVHGFYRTGSSTMGVSIAGALTFSFSSVPAGVGLRILGNDLGIGFGSTADTILARDAANTLALRNGANAQESRVYGSYTSATNFQRMSIKTLRESSGALSGASYTTTIAIPAYANLIGVTTRVTTEVTGATTYDVGDGTDVDLWGAAIGVALGSQSRTADFTAVGAVGAAATSRTVTLTANGSNFTGGVVEICLHYLTTEAD